MQFAQDVWNEAETDADRTNALPHPSRSFSYNGRSVRVDWQTWPDFIDTYREVYAQYVDSAAKKYEQADYATKLEVMKNAHTAAQKAAKVWWAKRQ